MPSATPRLRPAQTLLLGSLLFGLFFGAGNLIFPVSLGLQAGGAVTPAVLGFLVAAVGLPILGVVASALAESSSLLELASRVAPWFGIAFTCALYLTIGPFFAIPRTATVSYEMAFGGRTAGGGEHVALALFTGVFFAVVLAAAMRPGRLLDYIGRFLTPVFLVLLAILLVAASVKGGSVAPPAIAPYVGHAASQGILDGYNTMDALASLAFAIVVIESVRGLGVRAPGRIAVELSKAGVIAAVAMGVIYSALAVLGSRSTHLVARDENGAVALSAVADATFGPLGHWLAALIMLVACLKTAIGLVTACADMFATMFPGRFGQRQWAVAFTSVSFALANVGLDAIIGASIPVLQLLYPLAICIIVLGLLDRWVRNRVWAWRLPILLAGLVSLATVLRIWEWQVFEGMALGGRTLLPGLQLGFGWVLPAVIGLAIGLLLPARRS
ncbi:branched-chain amino acid transport system II carrier protein [Luteococcus sp. Sow4_B9]|uniref:branched-chain amino acid transport system II carrier protein n=1 Tax=Luteococcus sp. Sow4_B9 TaxID=3438792 RepID=UPI003F9E1422